MALLLLPHYFPSKMTFTNDDNKNAPVSLYELLLRGAETAPSPAHVPFQVSARMLGHRHGTGRVSLESIHMILDEALALFEGDDDLFTMTTTSMPVSFVSRPKQ